MNKQYSIDIANMLFAVFFILIIAIAFITAIVGEEPIQHKESQPIQYTPSETQEDRPAWNYLTNQWEKLDCDTDSDCEQKYGEEPVHQHDDETFPPAKLYPLIDKGINDKSELERRIV